MHYLIIGFGLTGQAILKYLVQKTPSSDLVVTIYDQKVISQEFVYDLIKISSIKLHLITDISQLVENKQYQDIDLAIASPGVYPAQYREFLDKKFHIEIISDIQLFANDYLFRNDLRNYNQIYGITGTNGKSTACALLHFILGEQSCLAGNYGLPAVELITNHEIKPQTVLELSSYQLELSTNLPMLAATCLNISPDHLDWHEGYENYIKSKLKIYNDSEFDILDSKNALVLDSYKTNVLPEKTKKQLIKIIYYSNDSVCEQAISDVPSYGFLQVNNANTNQIITFNSQEIIAVRDLPEVLQTSHNLCNLLAVLAMLAAKYFHVNSIELEKDSKTELLETKVAEYLKQQLANIGQFKGLSYRCELVANFNDIRVYNDSKATNLNATITAINSFANLVKANSKIILILGGIVKEDIDITESRQEFIACINKLDAQLTDLIIFSKDEASKLKFINLVDEVNNSNREYRLSYKLVEDLPSLRRLAYQMAKPGDIILFSPAGASFDAFKNYIDRGKQFTDCMKEIFLTTFKC